jgi:Protein of unknown function with HXXEE motif
MPFRRLAWALPAAYAVHVAEEAPGFTRWAQRNASRRYSQRDFVRNNAFGFVTTMAATLAVTRIERRRLDLTHYTLVVTQQAAFNAVFHSAATLAFREYSPGLVTSILHLPLWRQLTRMAVAERRLSTRDVVACTIIAGAVHAVVVARQVFFVGVPERR